MNYSNFFRKRVPKQLKRDRTGGFDDLEERMTEIDREIDRKMK